VPCITPYLCEEVYDFLADYPLPTFSSAIFTRMPSMPTIRIRPPPYETKNCAKKKFSLNIASFFEATRHFFLSNSSENYINKVSFLLPRFMMGLVNAEYGTGLPDLCKMPIYLKQLANVVTTR
jgi:hypothetical protein